MTLIFKRSRRGPLAIVFGAVMAMGFEAAAQETEAVQKVVELNKKALASFSNLDVEDAANLLKQALDTCSANQLDQHPAAARTHVHMGVVYVAGLKKREQGLDEFKKALRIDPNIKVTKSLANPEVQAAFQEAAMDISDGEAPAPAPAPTPAPEPTPVVSEPVAPPVGSLVHVPVREGIAGQAITVKVQAPATLAAARVVVAYRAEGTKEYTMHELDVLNNDWYQGQIPADATSGSMVTYYIVAYNEQGQSVAQDGSQSEPHVIALGEGGIINGATGPSEYGGSDDEEEVASGGGSIWLSLSVGTGFGYHSGQPEANRTNDDGKKLNSSGMSMARLLHISPELGYFVTDSMLLSLQGRFQLVSGATSVKGTDVAQNPTACKGGTCKPSSFAMAALVKATWFLGEPRTVTPFLSLAAGAGQIRHVVSVGKLSGCPSGGCKDTVVGGPVLVGAGGGMAIELSESLSFVASANALVGVPKFLANLDINLGLAYLH